MLLFLRPVGNGLCGQDLVGMCLGVGAGDVWVTEVLLRSPLRCPAGLGEYWGATAAEQLAVISPLATANANANDLT